MAKPVFKYTPREIYEADFETKMRGYDKNQVDELLDGVIIDYETYQAELLRLQEENEFLKNRISDLEKGGERSALTGNSPDISATQRIEPPLSPSIPQIKEPSNFDLIKRINRLERAVFGTTSDDKI